MTAGWHRRFFRGSLSIVTDTSENRRCCLGNKRISEASPTPATGLYPSVPPISNLRILHFEFVSYFDIQTSKFPSLGETAGSLVSPLLSVYATAKVAALLKFIADLWSVIMTRWIIGIGLLTIAVGLGGAGYGVWTIWHQHHVITSALSVKATVTGHQTEDLKAGGFVAKVPLVEYEYTVDKKPYTCNTVTPAEFMLPDTWAESVFNQFPVGAQVDAKYDPHDPSKAFLIAKYSVKPYLPLLVSLVIAAMGLGVVCEQLMNRDIATTTPTNSGAITLDPKQSHLTRARVLGIVGIVGLVFGAPAIMHHVMVSTEPHERMGFLLEGAYGIAVLIVLALSAVQFRQGAGFGTPVVTIDQSPKIGQSRQLGVSMPTRFNGTAGLNACLKCEAKDKRLFNISEEDPDTVLMEQHCLLTEPGPVTKGGELAGTAELTFPDYLRPSTPVDSAAPRHVVWSLILTAEGNGGRKAETEYILSVGSAPT